MTTPLQLLIAQLNTARGLVVWLQNESPRALAHRLWIKSALIYTMFKLLQSLHTLLDTRYYTHELHLPMQLLDDIMIRTEQLGLGSHWGFKHLHRALLDAQASLHSQLDPLEQSLPYRTHLRLTR